MSVDPIKVTVTDPASGEVLAEQLLDNDFLLLCAGDKYLHHTNTFPGTGTTVLTIKTASPKKSGEG